MKVALNIFPLNSNHSVRGIGSYTKNLLDALEKEKNIEITTFSSSQIPNNTDIVHYPFFDIYFHTLPIFKKNKTVITIHDVIPLIFPDKFPSGKRGRFNLMLQKIALKNIDAVICDSKSSKNDISQRLGYPQEKIHIIYLAPSNEFKPIENKGKLENVRKKYNLPEQFVLFVGDVNWNKNILGLLEAIAMNGIDLVLVGKAFTDDSLIQVNEINEKIKTLKLGKKVTKVGYVPQADLVSVYNLAKLTVLPSFYEGFGLPVLESMACGTPVVCSNNSSLAEVSGSLAIYCDPKSSIDISQKIEFCFKKNKANSKELISHANKFTWQKVASQTINVYENVFKNK